jgi:hypothetical protein
MPGRIDAASARTIAQISIERPARLWALAIALLGICAIAVAWFPLLSITALPSKNYNEGWNAYRQWMTVEGQPLYGNRSALWTTNYPFLSFHIIGWLGATKDNMVLAGRIVCFTSLIAISVLCGGIVQLATGSRGGAIYAGLYLFAGLGSFNGAGRAIDDPELLSVALATFGLFAYLKAPRRILWPALSAVAFALSLFTKHDLLGFPLSVGVYLLLTRNWRTLATVLITGAAISALLLILSFHIDGRYFFAELLQSRAYSLPNLCKETFHYLLHFLAPLLIAIILLFQNNSTPYRSFLFTLLIINNLTAVCFSCGDGVGSNIFYPALIADLLSCVIAICWLQKRRTQTSCPALSFRTALVISTLATVLMVPFQLHDDIIAQLRLPAATQAARQAITLLKSTNGPAICEDLLLCYEAGKPMDYDPYYVNDQILTGRVQESSILAMLTAHHYAAIQINAAANATSLVYKQGGRFTRSFWSTLLLQYRAVLISHGYYVLVPRT